MKHRYTFYWILWGLGELSGLGQWLLLRWALPVPEHELLLTFSLLPFVYLVPNILGNHLPLNVTRLLVHLRLLHDAPVAACLCRLARLPCTAIRP